MATDEDTARKRLKAAEEFHTSTNRNCPCIPNYGEPYRTGADEQGQCRIDCQPSHQQVLMQKAVEAVGQTRNCVASIPYKHEQQSRQHTTIYQPL